MVQISGLLATMTAMTLITLICGVFLDGGGGYVFYRRWMPLTPIGGADLTMMPVCRLRY
jgi:hypothetical protein